LNKPTHANALMPFVPLLFVVLWSTGFVGAKLGLPYCEPLTLLSLRYVGVLLVMGVVALATRAPWPASPVQWTHIGVSGLLVHAAYLGGVFTAIRLGLPAGVAPPSGLDWPWVWRAWCWSSRTR
jgi:drug/metabolite transporter (DMT)-like permease